MQAAATPLNNLNTLLTPLATAMASQMNTEQSPEDTPPYVYEYDDGGEEKGDGQHQ